MKSPKTLNEAVSILEEFLDEETKQVLVDDEDLFWQHHGLGRFLRNSWSLWRNSTPIVTYFDKSYEINHADDISSIVIAALKAKLQNVEYNIDADVIKYKEHWAKYDN